MAVVPARSIYNQNTNSGDLGLDSLLFFSTHEEQLALPFFCLLEFGDKLRAGIGGGRICFSHQTGLASNIIGRVSAGPKMN